MANTEILEKILGNDLCAKWINLRDYAFDKLSANPDIKAIMDEVDKYGYGEWVCEGQVPVMTSNTAPYGKCIADSEYNGQNAWLAFDNNDTSYWSSSRGANGWCGYHFIDPVIVKRVMFYPIRVTGTLRVKNYKIQGSNDGTTWTDLTDTLVADNEQKKQYVNIDNDTPYSYYRMFIIDSYGQDTLRLASLQFYAYQPKGNVPIMTSNTAPYGVASAYQVFDGNPSTTASGTDFSYQFTNPICVKDFICKTAAGVDIGGGTLQASNDGTTWVVPTAGAFYLYYRVHFTSSKTVGTVQFYGREMKVSVPAMTSNTAPWGEASATRIYSAGYEAYQAFHDQFATMGAAIHGWLPGAANNSMTYKFPKPVKIEKILHRHELTYDSTIKFSASKDGINWIDITDILTVGGSTSGKIFITDVENPDEYLYYKINCYSGDYMHTYGSKINYFGFDYSERDWDTEHPMKYLYDHGVELGDVDYGLTHSDAYFNKNESDMYVYLPGAARRIYSIDKIDFTDYDFIKTVIKSSVNHTKAAIMASDTYTNSNPPGLRFFDTANLPYNSYLEIQNINGYYYFEIGVGYSTTVSFYLEELWLE